MIKNPKIQQILSLLLLFSVLFTSLLGKESHGFLSKKTEQQSTKKENKDTKSAHFEELSVVVSTPSPAFEFGGFLSIFFTTEWHFSSLNIQLLPTQPLYFISTFFDKIFEHQIATNAP